MKRRNLYGKIACIAEYAILYSVEVYYPDEEILQGVWYSQRMGLADALTQSMLGICEAVIQAQGGWTTSVTE